LQSTFTQCLDNSKNAIKNMLFENASKDDEDEKFSCITLMLKLIKSIHKLFLHRDLRIVEFVVTYEIVANEINNLM
jgi:hypothetical protein